MSDKKSSKNVVDEKPVDDIKDSNKIDTAPYLKTKTSDETTGKSPRQSHRIAFSISAVALIGVIVYLASQLFEDQFKQGLATINETVDTQEIVTSVDNAISGMIDAVTDSGVIDSITTSYEELMTSFENNETNDTDVSSVKVEEVKAMDAKPAEETYTAAAASITEEAPVTEEVASTSDVEETPVAEEVAATTAVETPATEEVASTPVVVETPVTESVATTPAAVEATAPLLAQTTVPTPMVRTPMALPYVMPYATPYGYRPYYPAYSMPVVGGHTWNNAHQFQPYPPTAPYAMAQRKAFEAMMQQRREAFESAMRHREEAMKHIEVMRSAVYRDIEKNRAESSRRMEEQRIRMQKIRKRSLEDRQKRYRAMGELPGEGQG